MESDKEQIRFGSRAIFRGYATLNQIQQTLAEQVRDDVNGKPHRPIGMILRERGWITAEQEHSILEEMIGETQRKQG